MRLALAVSPLGCGDHIGFSRPTCMDLANHLPALLCRDRSCKSGSLLWRLCRLSLYGLLAALFRRSHGGSLSGGFTSLFGGHALPRRFTKGVVLFSGPGRFAFLRACASLLWRLSGFPFFCHQASLFRRGLGPTSFGSSAPLFRSAPADKSLASISGVCQTGADVAIEGDPPALSVRLSADARINDFNRRQKPTSQERKDPALLACLLHSNGFPDVLGESNFRLFDRPSDIPNLTGSWMLQNVNAPCHLLLLWSKTACFSIRQRRFWEYECE